jgi:hypothetical protein
MSRLERFSEARVVAEEKSGLSGVVLRSPGRGRGYARARRVVAGLALLVLLAGGSLAFGQVSGTFAIFTAETENPNAVEQGGWIPAPSSPASSLDGSPYSQENLTWVSGSSTTMPSGANPVTGQTIMYADGGSGASASCGSYTTFSTVSATATTADLTGSNIADWWCFRVYSTSATLWTSGVATFTPQRLFVPINTAAFTNSGTISGKADNGDTIKISANQTLPGSPGTIPVQVCSTGKIEIWSNACGTAGSIGEITGLTIASNVSFPNSTTAVSGSTLTITLGGATGSDSVSGTGSFTAGAIAVSSSGQQACTATPICSIPTSGSF